jgi:hypothetical protein
MGAVWRAEGAVATATPLRNGPPSHAHPASTAAKTIARARRRRLALPG